MGWSSTKKLLSHACPRAVSLGLVAGMNRHGRPRLPSYATESRSPLSPCRLEELSTSATSWRRPPGRPGLVALLSHGIAVAAARTPYLNQFRRALLRFVPEWEPNTHPELLLRLSDGRLPASRAPPQMWSKVAPWRSTRHLNLLLPGACRWAGPQLDPSASTSPVGATGPRPRRRPPRPRRRPVVDGGHVCWASSASWGSSSTSWAS